MKNHLLPVLALMVMLTIAGVADIKIGHGLYFWIFTVVTWLLLRLVGFGGVSWFYIFMAFFFFLGCWLKIAFHHIFDYPYVEPTGGFEGTSAEWDRYYAITISLALAFIATKLLYIIIFGRIGANSGYRYDFKAVSRGEWAALVGILTVFYALNNIFAIFVTGVNPILVLPFGLNAPLGFMAVSGFAIVLSVYISRDFYSNCYLTQSAAAVVLFFGLLASISMASRAAIVMQVLPMFLAAIYLQAKSARMISLKPFLMFGFTLVVVLLVVSLYRINVYMSESALNEEWLVHYASETVGLVIDRWIGAEAIMVAVSEARASLMLMIELLTEDPRQGSAAIYQILSGGKYEASDVFTFLTLPGYFGVLALSGSISTIVFGGMAIMFAGLFVERFIRWAMFRQAICVAVVCAALANALNQLSFPTLLVPFIFQLVALSLILRFVIRRFFIRARFSEMAG